MTAQFVPATLAATAVALLASRLVSRPARRPTPCAVTSTDDRSRATPAHRLHRRHRVAITSGLGVVALGLVAGPFAAVALAVALLLRPRWAALQAERSHRRAVDAAMPDAIQMLVLVVHAGLTPYQAVRLLAERAPTSVRPAFTEVVRRTRRGETLADALTALSDELGAVAGRVVDTLAMTERHGTPLRAALDQLSLDVRERRARLAEAEARRLPVQMAFPLVCCTLPSFVLTAVVPAVLAALSSLDTSGL
ncbi:MAG: type II secretion system F family protein [Ilumatobacter sp.]